MHASCLLLGTISMVDKLYFLGKNRKKCTLISKCCLLKILPSMLRLIGKDGVCLLHNALQSAEPSSGNWKKSTNSRKSILRIMFSRRLLSKIVKSFVKDSES